MNQSPSAVKDPLTIEAAPRRRYHGGEKKAPAKKPAVKKAKPAAPEGTEGNPVSETIKPPIPEHREDIQAPHKFTDEETAGMNLGLRNALDEIEMLQSQAKAAAQDFKLRIQNKQNDAKMLRTKLASGEETRPMKAAVEFEPKRSMKRFLNPETGAFIREEVMQPADWQLPMFKPAEDGTEKPAPKGAADVPDKKTKNAKAPATSPAGATNVGDALDAAAAGTKAPQFLLDLTKDDWDSAGLTRAFKAAAKKAGWTPMQISTLNDRLKEADSVDRMIDTLRPFTIAPGSPESLPVVDVVIDTNFPTSRVVEQFRKGARQAGWRDADIDRVCKQASEAALKVEDEPEAGQEAAKVFAPYVTPVSE